jgi:hypothetical protein
MILVILDCLSSNSSKFKFRTNFKSHCLCGFLQNVIACTRHVRLVLGVSSPCDDLDHLPFPSVIPFLRISPSEFQSLLNRIQHREIYVDIVHSKTYLGNIPPNCHQSSYANSVSPSSKRQPSLNPTNPPHASSAYTLSIIKAVRFPIPPSASVLV